MFKRKSKLEKVLDATKADQTEQKQTKPVLRFYDVGVISSAITILNDALKTGQLVFPSLYLYDKDSLCLTVLPSTLPFDGRNYIISPNTTKLESFAIKSKEEIDAEERAKKTELLKKLMESHAHTISEIEQLARELGVGDLT